ncbi:uncharacterized protein FSUBG_10440 [Fusarium subglutinans]|uniref:Chromo domain-containing protein n=1 Tax=Gibberella subglutinans TaxID=42677 RepID=A0A8H5UM07_GIBSU|nr:uncharacterized protein FSUBG_10440 [Fusarium subglutinans]KAF5591514.1 hypothetical protein FSUBG_10440 [Fusarium subglutinans]
MAANQDDREYEIERFMRHRVNRKKKTVEILVKWTGYTFPTWEPEALLQETAGRTLYRYWDELGGRGVATRLRDYHVFKILARVWKKGAWHYNCQWVGYSDLKADTSLETEKKVRRIARNVLAEFEAIHGAPNRRNTPAADL